MPAPGGQEGAEIGGAQFPDIGEGRRAGEMTGQESQKLAGVALIGIERMFGKTAFASEVFEPRSAFRHQARVGDYKQFIHVAGLEFAFKSANLKQERLWNC